MNAAVACVLVCTTVGSKATMPAVPVSALLVVGFQQERGLAFKRGKNPPVTIIFDRVP